MLPIEQLKEQSEGKWFGILREFGINVDESGKHTACPICGDGGKGKQSDRFRMEKDGTAYFCNQCNPKAGDTLQLIKKVTGLEFPEIIKRISGMIGGIEPMQKPKNEIDKRGIMRDIWKNSEQVKPNDPVMKYLMARKILKVPDDVRYCPMCYNSELKKKMPAMIGVFCGVEGKPVALQRIYLDGDKKASLERPKKSIAIDSMVGGAVRLRSVTGNHMGIAEGIETALACERMMDIPVWAALGTSLMESFEPPGHVRRISIFADNDVNFAGQKAAYTLANRLFLKPYELNVDVFVPKKVGDFNDELIEIMGESS